ncbi:MAG TPA: alpha/beta hydrolase [Gemmatimonadaceae bacterium]|nr:alpha/beta hydrolase [Gemmatimonadaceae bacterium]
MPRLLRFLALGLLILVFGAAGVYAWKNPESSRLDTAARAGVPGAFVALTHGTTHYESAGPDTGRVVLLVHGFSVPYYIWDSTFTALRSAGYRVIRYDLYGRGWSDRPNAAYDGALYDSQIDGLLDSLHVTGPVDLIGLSFGGFVTAHYVAGHPARVRTLTLVDPQSSGRQLPALLRTPVVGTWVWQVTTVPGMADNQASDFLHPERFPTWADQYRPQTHFKGFGRSLLRTVGMTSHVSFDTLYAAVARTGVPVLLVWGKQDQTVRLGLSAVVRRNVPAAEFYPVDSAGHLPHIEQAALVNARLFQFFAAHPAVP